MPKISLKVGNAVTYSPGIRVAEGTHKRVHESTTRSEFMSVQTHADHTTASDYVRGDVLTLRKSYTV